MIQELKHPRLTVNEARKLMGLKPITGGDRTQLKVKLYNRRRSAVESAAPGAGERPGPAGPGS